MAHAIAATLPMPDDALNFGCKDALAADETRFFIQAATWREDAKFKDKVQPQWYFRCTAAEDGVTRDPFLKRPIKHGEEFVVTFSDNRARRAIAAQVKASQPTPLGPYILNKVETDSGPMRFAWAFARAPLEGLDDVDALFPDLQRSIAAPSVLKRLAAPKGAPARSVGDTVHTVEAEDDEIPF